MFDKQVYVDRRNILRSKVNNGLILFPGNQEASYNYPANTYHFRQDSNFLYFFGLDQPDLAGVVDVDEGRDYIFGNDVDMDDIIWMGFLPSIRERAVKAGVTDTFPMKKLGELIKEAINSGRQVHFLPPYRGETFIQLEKLLGNHHSQFSRWGLDPDAQKGKPSNIEHRPGEVKTTLNYQRTDYVRKEVATQNANACTP